MRTFEEDLQKALNFHGHLCIGQVLGTRIARLGLMQFGITEPEKYKDLIIYVESDRCLADAVSAVCGCSLGRRRLKWIDYGKMAAVFYDIQTKCSYRIFNHKRITPEKGEDIIAFYNQYSDEELFSIQEVKLNITEFDLPGKPIISVCCEGCKEKVMDNRHVTLDGKNYCRHCADRSKYYRVLRVE